MSSPLQHTVSFTAGPVVLATNFWGHVSPVVTTVAASLTIIWYSIVLVKEAASWIRKITKKDHE